MKLEAIDNPTLRSKSRLLCMEVNPPRGVDIEGVFSRLDSALEGVDFLNVTDSALARMKCSPLPFASLLKNRYGLEPMVNLSCRDRNLIALQGDLLAGWMLGIRSVVALTGDAVTVGDSPDRKGVFEVNSIGLLNAIKTLDEGRDLAGNALKGSPHYYAGVVANPNAKNMGAELRRLNRKKEAGGRYALSQPVFEESLAVDFCKGAAELGMPIFLGLLPFKSAESVRSLSNVPGIKVPEHLVAESEKLEPSRVAAFSIDRCLKLAEAAKPYVAGFHVISGAAPKLGLDLARELAHSACK